MTLDEFQKKVEEYLSNNVSAFMGAMQLTTHERDDLKLRWAQLTKAEQTKASEFLSGKGIKEL